MFEQRDSLGHPINKENIITDTEKSSDSVLSFDVQTSEALALHIKEGVVFREKFDSMNGGGKDGDPQTVFKEPACMQGDV